MCRRLICMISLVVVIGLTLTSTASGELIAWWKFDETSGTTASDSSGKGHDGTLNGNATWAAGQLGGALQLDGSGDYVNCGLIDLDTALTGGMTVCAWINKAAGGDMKFCSNRQASNAAGGGFTCTVYQDRMEMDLSNATQRVLSRDAGGPTVPASTWVHLAWVYDDVANTFSEYHNGVLADTDTVTVSVGVSTQEFRIGADAPSLGRYVNGLIDDLRIYDSALSEQEILDAMAGRGPQAERAANPIPKDEATDVPREVVLSWTPGEFANTHDVYFGTVFDDVNDAGRSGQRGVLASQGQIATTYDPPGRLDLGQTYYWRIDEVNAPPTSTIFKGGVWSFTVEPLAYPIDAQSITATASSSNSAAEGSENTINGSGLNANDLHSVATTDMWLSSPTGAQPTWIQYEFDRIYKLHQMWVWNHNTLIEAAIGFGIKDATIEYSVDGANWTTLGTTHQFTRAPGAAGYAANTTIDLGGVAAKYVKITANSNWGGILKQYGLGEVRFLYMPVNAREPSPASGATDVSVDATLSWRAGREAAKHNVYLSVDEQAVIDGTAPGVTVTSPSYTSSLNLAGTYYWRVDEVNEAETPTTWQGDIWSLSTQEYLVVDDFESYNDIEAGKEGSNLVYDTWADGFANPTTNGSTIGYTEAFQPSMEKTRFFDGKQSVPLFYNNTAASISEATANVADLSAGKDWSKYGIKGLTLRFYGDPNNVPQQMYAKVNGAKVIYDGDAQNLKQTAWQMWYIDLASLGVNLGNVTTLTIGLERIGTAGGQGVVLLDAIRLYSYDRQLITPVDPGTAGLQAQYQFEGNANDSSGKGRNGIAMGGPLFVAGKVGQAISLDGTDDYVTITGYKGILADASGVQQPFTITAWVKTTDSGDRTIASWGTNTNMLRVDFRLAASRLRVEHGGGNVVGLTALNDDNWHHVALTMIRGATVSYPDVQLWLDGKDDTTPSTTAAAFSITAGVDMAIGYRATAAARYFLGAVDDVRLYDRALSAEEVAGLAGLTVPFDKPF